MTSDLIRLEDGREFPQYNGEALSWSPGLYHTWSEEKAGFPRMRAVIRAMITRRPEELERERRELARASLNSMFGRNASVALDVIEDELSK